jgi:hypothetical protein
METNNFVLEVGSYFSMKFKGFSRFKALNCIFVLINLLVTMTIFGWALVAYKKRVKFA